MFANAYSIPRIKVVAKPPLTTQRLLHSQPRWARNKSAGNVFETIAKENVPWPPM